MTMARFPRGAYTADGGVPEWITFIREVNRVRPGAFEEPIELADNTERYAEARVIHGTDPDEGVRVVADTKEMAEAFREVAAQLNIHMTPGAESS